MPIWDLVFFFLGCPARTLGTTVRCSAQYVSVMIRPPRTTMDIMPFRE